MKYIQAVNKKYSFKICSTIDKNRMNSGYVVYGIKFDDLIKKLKSQDISWAKDF